LLDQIPRHARCGGGIAHHDEFLTNDHTRVGVAFSGVGPAVLAELLKLNDLVCLVSL
jgi:hypothetical protein